MRILIKNALVINEGKTTKGSVMINNEVIECITTDDEPEPSGADEVINAEGLWLIPGVIDDQVHFRQPGLTHKANIQTESRAAVAGGVTSFMEMPNTVPQTTTIKLLEEKNSIAAENSFANYSFYFGATNDNLNELLKVDPKRTCGVKVFMGSSTGNMLVNNQEALSQIFSQAPTLIATHCEDETTILQNKTDFMNLYADNLDVQFHPLIRSADACYKSSSLAVELAEKHGSRLHVLHLSTAREMELFAGNIPLKQKKITAEGCVHHLWFSDKDYATYGNKIKWNPAIKTETDRQALIDAVNNDKIDVIATDHAPHTWNEKQGNCLTAASGGPLVQHSLPMMLHMAKKGAFTKEKVVEKMCHAPADLFRVERRGYIKSGYFADLVLIDPNATTTVNKQNLYYHCSWSPLEGETLSTRVERTFVNGITVYHNGKFAENVRGERLTFSV